MADRKRIDFKQQGLKKAAITGWLWNFVIKITTVLVTGLVFLITSRILDPVSFGIVAFAAAVVAGLAAIMPVGFAEALVQRQELEERHLNSVFWLCTIFASITYGLLILAAPLVAAYQDMPLLEPILYVLGTRLLFEAIAAGPNAILQRRMEFRALAIRTVLANLLGASTCLLLIYWGYPVWGLVMSQAVSPLVSMVVVLLTTRWRPSGWLDRASIKELASFGLSTLGINALSQARMEELLFGLLLGPAMLGLYFFARRLYTVLSDLFAGAFGGVSGVVFATLQSDPERRRAAFAVASFASAALGFPVFAGLLAIAPTAVPLVFGSQWEGAIVMVMALSVTGIQSSLGIIQGALIRYLGEATWWLRYQMRMRLSGWALIVLLAPFGGTVVVVTMAARVIMLWPMSVRKTAQLLDMPFKDYLASFSAPGIAALAMMGWVAALSQLMAQSDGWLLLAVQITSGGAIYCAILAVLARNRLREAMELWRKRKAG